MLGVCCCGGGEFGEAVAAVERNGDMLATADQPRVLRSRRRPSAMAFAMENPAEVMKVVIRGA